MKGKRGISAVVATILIILVTVAAVTIIWTTVLPMIQENVASTEQLNVDLSIETALGYTVYDPDTGKMIVQISRGNDDENLIGVQFIFTKDGNSETYKTIDIPEPNQAKLYRFDMDAFGGKPDSISVAGIFEGNIIGNPTSEIVRLAEGSLIDVGGLFINPLLNLSNETVFCNDSDGGLNYAVKGWANSSVGGFAWDFCLNSTTLGERYCNVNNNISTSYYVCSNGCGDGVCNAPCVYGEWVNDTCGVGSCSFNQLHQIRSVISGSGCVNIETCIFDYTCNLLADAVSWWRMDDINSSGDPTDYFGVNNGTAIGNAVQTDAGKFGKGWSFDGANSYIKTTNNSALSLLDNFTISVWINPKENVGRDYVVAKRKGVSLPDNYNTEIYSGRYEFWVYSGGWYGVTSGFNVDYNTWNHWVMTIQNGKVSFYKNGINDTSRTCNPNCNFPVLTKNNNVLSIGGSDAGGNLFNGTIDEVMIFDRALSSSDVLKIYNYFS